MSATKCFATFFLLCCVLGTGVSITQKQFQESVKSDIQQIINVY